MAGLLLLAMLARDASAAESSLSIAADRIVVEEDRVLGEGEVRLELLGQRCEATRFSLDRSRLWLVLEHGRCEDQDGELFFARAELDLEGSTGILVQARLEQPDGPLVVRADQLILVEAGRLEAENATFSLCRCPRGPWSVEARRVEVVVDEVARFRGGWIRICDQRVLPVPIGRVPLSEHRSGLRLPEVGWGRDGLLLRQPVALTGSDTELVLSPEWRQERGLRALGDLEYRLSEDEGGAVGGFAGWDWIRQQGRGALAVEHGWTPGPLRTAIDGAWTSDEEVLSDYGDDFLSRSQPWLESLALVGAGPLRLETDRFQDLSGQEPGQRPLGAVLTARGQRLGPLATGGTLRVDLFDRGDPFQTTAPFQRLQGGLGISTGEELGPLRLVGEASGRATRWAEEAPWAEGRLGGALLVPMWGDLGELRHLADLGVEGGLAGVEGEPAPRLPSERPAPAWRLGPALHSRWLSGSGLPISTRLAAPFTAEGFRPAGTLRLQASPWSASLQADAWVQDGRVSWDDGVFRLGLGAMHASPLLQALAEAHWRLPGPLSELRPGWRGLHDIRQRRFLSQGPELAYDSRCDCLSALAGARWSADRPVPDLFLGIELR